MKFQLTGIAQLILEHHEGDTKSKLVSTNFNLEVGDNVQKDKFLTKDELPTEAGVHAITTCFVQGLVANIHYAHAKGYINDAEHLRKIIAELERGFIQIAKISVAHFGDK